MKNQDPESDSQEFATGGGQSIEGRLTFLE